MFVWSNLSVSSFFSVSFFLFRAKPVAYGSSQARSRIGTAAAGLLPQAEQCQILAMSTTYATAHGNVGSLTHWARPGIEPVTSWFLVGFISAAPPWELLVQFKFMASFGSQIIHNFTRRIQSKIKDLLQQMEEGLKTADPHDCSAYTGWTGKAMGCK